MVISYSPANIENFYIIYTYLRIWNTQKHNIRHLEKAIDIMIYFDSDYMSGAHPKVMERLMDTNLEQTKGYESTKVRCTIHPTY
jgi:hypothetical protein